jgi:putative ABC transport system permease protein
VRRVTLRSLREHKRRLVSTVIAVLLGVAFMSGTLVFADTLDKVFDDLFAKVNEDVDAQVQGVKLFSSNFGGDQRQLLDERLVDEVADVDGVAAAAPFVQAFGFGASNRILDAQGDAIGANSGPPTLLQSWVDDDRLNPFNLVDGGRAPVSDDQFAINVAAAEDGKLEVGDRVRVITQLGERQYTLVGIFTFGDADSAAGAVTAGFTLAEAQRLAGTPGKLQTILIDGDEGLSQEQVVARVKPVLPSDAEVITGDEAAEQTAESVQEGFAFFRFIFVTFAFIALVVGTFIISNTFSILIAQRTRELALLRAVGASRRQVLGSVLLEAVIVGAMAAVLGLLVGIALVLGVNAALSGLGVDLPASGLSLRPTTMLLAVAVGLGVTVVAAIVPAVRATRVAPLAALREVSVDRAGASRIRIVLGVLVLAFAVLNLARAWTADGDTDAVPIVGLGALLAIAGAIVIGPVLAGPTVRMIGAALPRMKGVTGRIAMENAARSPKRTSATASALLIGVALIGFITVFAASAKKSVSSEIDRGFKADLIVQADVGFGPPSPFPTQVTEAVAATEGVDTVSAFGFAEAEFTYPDNKTARNFVSAIEPETFLDVFTPRMEQGRIDDLNDDGIVVDRQLAEEHKLKLGDRLRMVVPGGASRELTLQGISDDTTVLGYFIITRDTFAAVVPEQLDVQVFATIDNGADLATVQAAVEKSVERFPSMEVLDRDGFIGDLAGQLTVFVNIIYGLLAMSIIIAMIGVANTLSLSIHERTRELGLLRAVGMDQPQVRSAVRWEAVVIAVLGTLTGLALGLVLSRALVESLEGFGLTQFDVPIVTLVIMVVIAACLAVLASILPARRAARLDILRAIASE